MEKIRIIPKLEIKNNFLIKGMQFEGLRKIGDPKEFAKKYFDQGADQIIVLDIVASLYNRDNLFNIVDDLTKNVFIPITAGGGIRKVEDVKSLLKSGADRVSLNTAAFEDDNIIDKIQNIFGRQFLTIVIEARRIDGNYFCMTNHGRESSGITVKKWLKKLKKKNIAEIIITSVDKDGLNKGPDFDLLKVVRDEEMDCSVIYSGGLNTIDQISKVIKNFKLSGVAISSILHIDNLNIRNIKKNLKLKGINVNEI